MYIFRDHTKIRKYIFPFAFPRFLTTQTPSTKQSSKYTLKKKKKRENSEETYRRRGVLKQLDRERQRDGRKRMTREGNGRIAAVEVRDKC